MRNHVKVLMQNYKKGRKKLTKSASCFSVQWLQYILLSPQTVSPLKNAFSPFSCKRNLFIKPYILFWCIFDKYITIICVKRKAGVPRCSSDDSNLPPQVATSKRNYWNHSCPCTCGMWSCGSAFP